MKTISVKEASIKWSISKRSVRNYCKLGKIENASLVKGEWAIPFDAVLPNRKNANINKNYLLTALRKEKKFKLEGRIYHKLQIEMTYNSNHIEGSKLTHDETRYIYETKTIGIENKSKTFKIDDLIETINHFKCIDKVIDFANYPLSTSFIKELHKILKTGTSDSNIIYNKPGEYKKLDNQVGDIDTTPVNLVSVKMDKLIKEYNNKSSHDFDDILDFHVKFERIHPFQDGNGRVGRLIAFKECLKNNLVPFIITDDLKLFYYRGLSKWNEEKGWLKDTCLSGQDLVKKYLDYFKIRYRL